MAKNFAPEKGRPLGDFLKEFGQEVWDGGESKFGKMARGQNEVRQIVNDLLESSNWGACVNERQERLIRRHLLRTRGSAAEILAILTPVVMNAEHQCENCLDAGVCKNCDPDVDVSRILEKADPRLKRIAECELSFHAGHYLDQADIKTLGELTQMTRAEVLAVRNFREGYLDEVEALLAQFSLKLKD